MPERYTDNITILETNIDDSTGEMLGYVLERLFKAGAKDAFYTSIYMKKNRPAYKLTIICDDSLKETMEDIVFEETTAIGIRCRTEIRTCLTRTFEEIDTPYGPVRVKCVYTKKGPRMYPEYDCVREIAQRFNVPLYEVYAEIKSNRTI